MWILKRNRKLFIQDGNSIAWGWSPGDVQSRNNLGTLTWKGLGGGRDYKYYNKAGSGLSILENIKNLPTKVFPLFSKRYDKIIVAVYEGTNYLTVFSALDYYGKLMEYANLILNHDERTCVLLYTCAASALVPEEKRKDFNSMLLAKPETNRLKVVDITKESLLNDHTDVDIFYDGTHTTDDGNMVLARYGVVKALQF